MSTDKTKTGNAEADAKKLADQVEGAVVPELDADGNPIVPLDADGNPIVAVDADGNPIVEEEKLAEDAEAAAEDAAGNADKSKSNE